MMSFDTVESYEIVSDEALAKKSKAHSNSGRRVGRVF